jgi:methylenetetrahydrofolate reductase (NADPH)
MGEVRRFKANSARQGRAERQDFQYNRFIALKDAKNVPGGGRFDCGSLLGRLELSETISSCHSLKSCTRDLSVTILTLDSDAMRIRDAYGPGRIGLSFELFPPKTAEAMASLGQHLDELVKFAPSYITCTFGAGGSTQGKTLEVIAGVREKYGLPVATHLTCVGLSASDIHGYLRKAMSQGVENVVALRGDPPRGETTFRPAAGGFSYANELVAFIRKEFARLGVAVAGYPETHQEAPSAEVDLQNLKRKVDAGADAVITQLFYNNEDFFRFRDRCRVLGINVPIVPGLLPVTNLAQIQRIASLCGAKLPSAFVAALQKYANDPEGQFEVGVDFATEQTHALLADGVPGIHFYVLNKSEATRRVLSALPQFAGK